MASGAIPEVMVVETDPTIRQTLQTLLEAEGFSVVTADTGQTALQLLSNRTVLPAAVIIERDVAVMNAAQFLQALRSYTRFLSLPVLVCHGTPLGDPRNRACIPYVPRPATGGALLGVLKLIVFAKGTTPPSGVP